MVLSPAKPPAQIGRKIAIAWKDSAESARAVTAAAPILARAARTLVLTAGESSDEAFNCIECAEDIAESLRWHGHPVDAKYLVPGGRRESDAVLQEAYAAQADLLISGAYGHSRLRETVFGGFTQRLLENAGLPVFLFH